MPKIEIYTKDYCPYCHKALALLSSKNVEFTHYDITHDEEKQQEMAKRIEGRRPTVPQVFVDDVLLGGCDDVHALDTKGELDKIVGV